MMNKSVVCFGEVLWDNLPSGRRPGGAPMNVAYHLSHLGVGCTLISRVGHDESGESLRQFLQGIGLKDLFLQEDEVYATSEVLGSIDVDNEVSYTIVSPVAWDNIHVEPQLTEAVANSDVFVYGSLAARSKGSRESLMDLLEKARYRVFDVNLRSPHYSPELIGHLLRKADTVKLNLHELDEVASGIAKQPAHERYQAEMLVDRYGLNELIVTKGSRGGTFYTASARQDFPAIPVHVKDTVGSGDAFLAAFLSKKIENRPISECLAFASALGAFVAAQPGACPTYTPAAIEQFIKQYRGNVTRTSTSSIY